MNSLKIDSILTLIASILASNGLVSGSGTSIIGSMLVSPLTNPLLEFAKNLSIDSYFNWYELGKLLLYIIMCIITGYIYFFIYYNIFYGNKLLDTVRNQSFSEMIGRTDGRPGAFINTFIYAFLAGILLAFSYVNLEDNILVNVGVSIGTALLPPAVNCGALIAKKEYTNAAISLGMTGANVLGLVIGYIVYIKIQKRKNTNEEYNYY